jgi:hypothetical protein
MKTIRLVVALKIKLNPEEWPHLVFGSDNVKLALYRCTPNAYFFWDEDEKKELENYYANTITTMCEKEKEGYQIVLIDLDQYDYEDYGFPYWVEEIIFKETD